MDHGRPTPLSTAIVAVGVVVVAAAAVWQAPNANWELALLGTLLAFSIFSEIMSVETESHLKISGNYLAMVPAMVFLGGTPGGADRPDLDPRRLDPLSRQPATTCWSTSGPSSPSRW